MTGSININGNSVVPSDASGVLPEDVRREYLTAMGVQTWYDPTLEFQSIAPESISNQITSSEPDITVSAEVSVAPDVEAKNTPPQNQSQKIIEKTFDSLESNSPQVQDSSSIDLLNATIEECQLCELHAARNHAICGEGNVNADLMIVTSAPVIDESLDVLFSKIHKDFLQLVLQAIDVDFKSVYLTSLVKCRPPEQRAPFTSEMICCDDHLSSQIKLIQPKVIMVLGERASQQLLVSQKSLTDLRLRRHHHLGVPVYASYHPQEIIGSIQTKRKVWQDLLQIKNQLMKPIET